jgi:hypothetical protein
MSGFYEVFDTRQGGGYLVHEGRGGASIRFPWPVGFVYVVDMVNWTAAQLPKSREHLLDFRTLLHQLVFLPPPTQPRRHSR